MSDILRPDLCILGAGVGGSSLAANAAARGLPVVLVEKRGIGGEKLALFAPGHAFLAASRHVAALSWAGGFGFDADEPRWDFARVRRQGAAVVAALARNDTQARLEAMNVKVIAARGQFTGRDCLEAGGYKIMARHFVVATGASVKSVGIPGLDLIRPLTYATLCALNSVPRHLVVSCADPFGLALAQGFRRFGADVTVIAESKVFAGVDDEFGVAVRTEFAREGVVILEGVTISRIEPQGEGFRAFLAARTGEGTAPATIEGSHLLLATGSAPRVEGLGLTAARVRYDLTGIAVDAKLRTSNRRIFAIGRAARGLHSGDAAEYQAGLVLRTLLGLPAGRMRRGAVARVIPTDPEIAETGLSEAEAREHHRRIRVLRWPFSETDRAQYQRAPSGHVKIITTARGTILGAGIVGPEAGELINLCTLAISQGMTAAGLASIMVPYPVSADALRRAAALLPPAESRGKSMIEHIFRVLRRLG